MPEPLLAGLDDEGRAQLLADLEQFGQLGNDEIQAAVDAIRALAGSRGQVFRLPVPDTQAIAEEAGLEEIELESVIRLLRFILYAAVSTDSPVEEIGNRMTEELEIDQNVVGMATAYAEQLWDIRDAATASILVDEYLGSAAPALTAFRSTALITPLFDPTDEDRLIGSVPMISIALVVAGSRGLPTRVDFVLDEKLAHQFLADLQEAVEKLVRLRERVDRVTYEEASRE